ncbi:hypothetical protein SLA2020_149930 [Shorea laevis]
MTVAKPSQTQPGKDSKEGPTNNNAFKGKQVVDPAKAQNKDLGQSSNPVNPPPLLKSPNYFQDGSFEVGIQTPTTLEASLLTVKDRIKELEKGSGCIKKESTAPKTSKPPLVVEHGQPTGDTNISSTQLQPSNPSDSQRECDYTGESLRSDIIMGKENSPTVERGGDLPGVAQSSFNPKIYQSNSFPKLNTSFEGGSESFDRSMQHSKNRVHYRRSRHRREFGPYSTSEVHSSGMAGTSSSLRNDGQNGEDPCYHQVLNIVQDQGGVRLQVPNASIPLSGSVNDATAQGNAGTFVQANSS